MNVNAHASENEGHLHRPVHPMTMIDKPITKCDVCKDMRGTDITVPPNLTKVYDASVAGCHYCNFCMWIWMSNINQDWATHYDEIKGRVRVGMRWSQDGPGPAEVEFFYPFTDFAPPSLERTRTYAVFNPTDQPIPGWEQLSYTVAMTNNASSDAPWLDFARHSIDTCVGHSVLPMEGAKDSTNNTTHNAVDRHRDSNSSNDGSRHTECDILAPSGKSIILPTRLVEIIPGVSDVVLVETTKHRHIYQYATLSHSWGDPAQHRMFKTSLDNYENNLTNIPWTSLPATFQDAITVCRHLNMKHIWIDSLCIIQDDIDNADFVRESVRMCDYYGNSFLTISGTRSGGCSTGFLSSRIYPFEPIKLPFGEADIDVSVRRLTTEESSWSIANPNPRPQSVHPIHITMPILSRAWVFQENSLSRRVLHFLDHDILFECSHSLSSQSRVLPRGTRQLFNRIHSWRSTVGDASNRWRWSIENYYFAMRISYVSDRLPAMSGLAEAKFRQFAKTRSPPQSLPTYLAGLWDVSLHQDLCWRMSNECGEIIRSCYVAPTWSWASLRGESIAFMANSKNFTSLIRLLGNFVVLKNKKMQYGEVAKGSYISLFGGCRHMILTVRLSTPPGTTTHTQDKTQIEKLERKYGLSFADEVSSIVDDEFAVSLDTRLECSPLFPHGYKYGVFALPVSAILVGEEPGRVHGLILTEIPQSLSGLADCKAAFRRISYFRTRANHKKMVYDDEANLKGGRFIDDQNVMDRVEICKKEFLKGEMEVSFF